MVLFDRSSLRPDGVGACAAAAAATRVGCHDSQTQLTLQARDITFRRSSCSVCNLNKQKRDKRRESNKRESAHGPTNEDVQELEPASGLVCAQSKRLSLFVAHEFRNHRKEASPQKHQTRAAQRCAGQPQHALTSPPHAASATSHRTTPVPQKQLSGRRPPHIHISHHLATPQSQA